MISAVCLQIGGLAAHVRTGQHQDGMSARIQVQIIGYEALATAQLQLLDYRVACPDNLEVGRFVELRAAVVP